MNYFWGFEVINWLDMSHRLFFPSQKKVFPLTPLSLWPHNEARSGAMQALTVVWGGLEEEQWKSKQPLIIDFQQLMIGLAKPLHNSLKLLWWGKKIYDEGKNVYDEEKNYDTENIILTRKRLLWYKICLLWRGTFFVAGHFLSWPSNKAGHVLSSPAWGHHHHHHHHHHNHH